MDNSRKKSKGFYSFLFSFYKPVRGTFWAMIILMLVSDVFNLLGTYTVKNVVNMPFGEGFVVRDLYVALAFIGTCFLLEIIAKYSSMVIRSIPLRDKQGKLVTQKLFNHLNKKSYAYFADNYSGKISNAIGEASKEIDHMNKVFVQDIMICLGGMISSFVILLSINVIVFVVSFVFYFGVIVGRLIFFKYTYLRHQRNAQVELREFNGQVNDAVMNFTSLRVYNSVDTFSENIVSQKGRELNNKNKASKCEFFYGFTVNFLHVVVLVAMACFGINLYTNGSITIGDLVFIMTSMISIKSATTSISWQIVDISDTLVILNNSYEVLYDDNNIVEENKPAIEVTTGKLEFKNLTFKYSSEPVFTDFNLTIEDRQKVGIIGVSGSGKSTLVNLLFKFYSPNSGSIEFDGKNIQNYSNSSLYKNLTYVPQETILLHSTIFENIKLAKPEATDDEVYEAAKKAELHKFIESLPEKYNTIVGERGIKLSGGQRQRIALARIFLKNTKIVVFDEATSALDNETEVKIQNNINKYFSDQTIICIAHRLSTLTDMDIIYVIEEGKIVDKGKPKVIIPKYSKASDIYE